MKKAAGNNIEKFAQSEHFDVQTAKQPSGKTAKHPNRQKVTYYLDPGIIAELKILAAKRTAQTGGRIELSELVEAAIKEYLLKHKGVL